MIRCVKACTILQRWFPNEKWSASLFRCTHKRCFYSGCIYLLVLFWKLSWCEKLPKTLYNIFCPYVRYSLWKFYYMICPIHCIDIITIIVMNEKVCTHISKLSGCNMVYTLGSYFPSIRDMYTYQIWLLLH